MRAVRMTLMLVLVPVLLALGGCERSFRDMYDQPRCEPLERSDPLANQVRHFAAVIRGRAEPICSGRDGLATLKVVDAVVEAARTKRPVEIAI